jgi:hypothetical protein
MGGDPTDLGRRMLRSVGEVGGLAHGKWLGTARAYHQQAEQVAERTAACEAVGQLFMSLAAFLLEAQREPGLPTASSLQPRAILAAQAGQLCTDNPAF